MKKYEKLKVVVDNYIQDVVTSSTSTHVDDGLFIEDDWSET